MCLLRLPVPRRPGRTAHGGVGEPAALSTGERQRRSPVFFQQLEKTARGRWGLLFVCALLIVKLGLTVASSVRVVPAACCALQSRSLAPVLMAPTHKIQVRTWFGYGMAKSEDELGQGNKTAVRVRSTRALGAAQAPGQCQPGEPGEPGAPGAPSTAGRAMRDCAATAAVGCCSSCCTPVMPALALRPWGTG